MTTADNRDIRRIDAASAKLQELATEFNGRRREVLMKLLGFQSEKEIAADLDISRHTVHGHAKVIYAVCRVHNRRQLRLLCIQSHPPEKNVRS